MDKENIVQWLSIDGCVSYNLRQLKESRRSKRHVNLHLAHTYVGLTLEKSGPIEVLSRPKATLPFASEACPIVTGLESHEHELWIIIRTDVPVFESCHSDVIIAARARGKNGSMAKQRSDE